MGKINEFQNEQNGQNNTIINMIRTLKEQTSKRKILGINTSLDNKNYSRDLSTGAKKIATLATILLVGGMTVGCSSRTQSARATEMQMELLQKDTVMSDSRDTLLDILFGDNRDETNTKYTTNYSFDKNDGSTTLKVSTNKNGIDEVVFIYSPDFLSGNFGNAPEIRTFLDNMIEVEINENPSQKDLEKLNTAREKVEEKEFKLDGKNIVAVDDKDKGWELE